MVTHTMQADIERIDARIDALKDASIEKLWGLHAKSDLSVKDGRNAIQEITDQLHSEMASLFRERQRLILISELLETTAPSVTDAKVMPGDLKMIEEPLVHQVRNDDKFPSNGRLTAREVILGKLAEKGQLTVREIDDLVLGTGLSKPSSNKARSKLTQDGLIQKVNRAYCLTEKGQKFLEVHGRPTMS